MNRLALCFVGLFAIVSVGLVSCGSADMAPPPYLKVKAFLPGDGAHSVSVGVEPYIYFNGDVDSSSVTSSSFYLESGSREYLTLECEPDNREPCDCDLWTGTVNGRGVTSGSKVVFETDEPLDTDCCYRLTATTDVRGVELGPLEDLRWPVACRQKVGAHGVFCTPEAAD